MFKSKKIKELEYKVNELVRSYNNIINNIVPEHTTGLLINKDNAKEIEVREFHFHASGFAPMFQKEFKSYRYYLKDKAPDCDYIKIKDGKETYYKNNLIVDAKGVCKK